MGWQVVLLEPAKVVFIQIGQFLLKALLVVIILIVGWVIAKFIRTLVTRILKTVKLDTLSEDIGLNDLLAKGGIQHSLSELIGDICYWLALLLTFIVAMNAMELTIAAELLNRVALYIPNVIAAIFILILGMFVATLLKNIVHTSATNAGISQANLLSKIVEVIVGVFAVAIALGQLNIGARIIELAVGIFLGAIGLAVALAFGLGCKDIAARYISDVIDKIKSKK